MDKLNRWLRFSFQVLVFLIITWAGCSLIDKAYASGLKDKGTTQVTTDSGDERTPYNVSCSSHAWSVARSSDQISRGQLYQWDKSNSLGICLSTTSTIGNVCDRETPGVMLSSGTPAYTDYSKAGPTYCRAESFNTVAQRLRGFIYRDRGDLGNVRP